MFHNPPFIYTYCLREARMTRNLLMECARKSQLVFGSIHRFIVSYMAVVLGLYLRG